MIATKLKQNFGPKNGKFCITTTLVTTCDFNECQQVMAELGYPAGTWSLSNDSTSFGRVIPYSIQIAIHRTIIDYFNSQNMGGYSPKMQTQPMPMGMPYQQQPMGGTGYGMPYQQQPMVGPNPWNSPFPPLPGTAPPPSKEDKPSIKNNKGIKQEETLETTTSK
jgi:hypothetical protein